MLTILAEIGDRLSDHSHSALNDQLHYQYLCVEELQAGGGGGDEIKVADLIPQRFPARKDN